MRKVLAPYPLHFAAMASSSDVSQTLGEVKFASIPTWYLYLATYIVLIFVKACRP